MSVKLWHDDVRPAPEGWVWARTNQEAIKILMDEEVTHISLDHDLGNHDCEPGTCDVAPGSGMPQKGEETGFHLVEWMIATNHIPGWIRVHAWNPSGGDRMYQYLKDVGANVTRQSYRHGEVISV